MVFPRTERNLSKNIKDINECIVKNGVVIMQGAWPKVWLVGNPDVNYKRAGRSCR